MSNFNQYTGPTLLLRCAVAAATRHVIDACNSLPVTVPVEPYLYAASPVAASPGSVQHQSGPLRQQKGCLQAACARTSVSVR